MAKKRKKKKKHPYLRVRKPLPPIGSVHKDKKKEISKKKCRGKVQENEE
jgi:hypothetical protein